MKKRLQTILYKLYCKSGGRKPIVLPSGLVDIAVTKYDNILLEAVVRYDSRFIQHDGYGQVKYDLSRALAKKMIEQNLVDIVMCPEGPYNPFQITAIGRIRICVPEKH